MAGKAIGYYIHLRHRPGDDSAGETRTLGPFPGPVHVYAACAVYVPGGGGREVLHWSRDGWYVVGMAEWHGYTDFAISTDQESPYTPDGR